jgi:hypothetical protein
MKATHSNTLQLQEAQEEDEATEAPSPPSNDSLALAESLADISGHEAKTTKAVSEESTRQNRTSQTITPPFRLPRRVNISVAEKAMLADAWYDLVTSTPARDRCSETISLSNVIADELESPMGCLVLNEEHSLTRSVDDSISIYLGIKDSADHWRKSSMCVRSLPLDLLDSLSHMDFDEEAGAGAEPRPNEVSTVEEEASGDKVGTTSRRNNKNLIFVKNGRRKRAPVTKKRVTKKKKERKQIIMLAA